MVIHYFESNGAKMGVLPDDSTTKLSMATASTSPALQKPKMDI